MLNQLIGGWPVITPNWSASSFNLYESLRNLYLNGYSAIFYWNISTNRSNLSRIIKFEGPVVKGGPGDIYRPGNPVEATQAYRYFIREIVTMLSPNTSASVLLDVRDLVDFEENLAGNFVQNSSTNSMLTLGNFTRRYLSTSILGRELIPLLQRIFSVVGLQRLINGTVVVEVANLQFFQRLAVQLQALDRLGHEGKKILANYLGWRVVFAHLTTLPAEFLNSFNKFSQLVSGANNEQHTERETTCADLVTSAMPFAVGFEYTNKLVPTAAKEKV